MNNPLDNKTTNPFVIAKEAANEIKTITGVNHYDIAVTLGSGWGKAAETIGTVTHVIPAEKIIGFEPSKVAGHNSNLKSLILPDGRNVLIIGARTHFYESNEPYHVRKVAHGMRTASALGCKTVVLTNGAGSIKTEWIPGTVVLIKDHINLTSASPLEGATFIDLTDLYSYELREEIRKEYPDMPEGVYIQNRGPAYETVSEVSMARIIGGDIVGMSTSLEAIAAREAGMKIVGMSLITNHAAGTIANQPLNHQEVLDTGKASEEKLSNMLAKIIWKI